MPTKKAFTNIIPRKQHLRLTEDIRTGIDNEKQFLTFLLLFDFSKAFDTMSPSKLLRKLILMGFSGSVVLWVVGRKQRVVAKLNGESDWLTTNLGVPQGSVLGPPCSVSISMILRIFSLILTNRKDFYQIVSRICFTQTIYKYTHKLLETILV